jgi:serine/threonine protein kinase
MTDGAMVEAESFTGEVVDERFQLGELLGEGAVGQVYKALDLTTKKEVAVKIWSTASLDEQTMGRFQRETRALETLAHPNIIDVFGYGAFKKRPYVAMELLRGQTLDQLLDGQPLEPALAQKLTSQMLDALAFAHELQVLHRDLKPENIYVTETDKGEKVVKILDYGLAKFMTGDTGALSNSKLTVAGMVMGSPLYMAPEQALGEAVDLRADVYAAGCVFFEMLTGQPPFLADTAMQLIVAHTRAPIPKLEETYERLALLPGVQAIVDKALAKKPDDRYPDAGEMFEAFQALPAPLAYLRSTAKGKAKPAAPAAPGTVAMSTKRTEEETVKLAMIGVGVAVVLMGVLWWLL